DRKLTIAERRRADPSGEALAAALAAREALVEFNLALRWSGGTDPEAHLGIGRCYALLGEYRAAEEAFRSAEPLPAAKVETAWLWARRLLEGRREPTWEAQSLLKLPVSHPVRLYAEGRWERLLQA